VSETDRPDSKAESGFSGFRAVLGSKGFRRLFIGQSVSSLGDWVATLAFIAAAFNLTHGNQTAVAVVLVLRLVPPIFAAPVGGVIADRLYRRTIMVSCDLARAALIVLVPFFNIWVLYAIAFVHESISLFFLPARDASVPLLIPEGTLEEANGLILASSYGSIPIAAALFGVLRLAASHIPGWVPFGGLFRDHPTSFSFFFDAVTFLFSATMIAGLDIRRQKKAGEIELLRDVAEGISYVVKHPGLRSMAYGLIVSMFGGGVLFAVGIGYIHTTLHGSDAAFGWLAALWGLGMGLGLGVVRLLVKRGRPQVFLGAVVMCGGVLIFMALVPVLWLAFIAAVVFGTVFSVAIVLALTLAQEVAEDRIRGRIMGGVQMLFRVGLGAGALGIGALAHSIRRIHVVVTLDGNQVGLLGGGVLILLGAVAASGVTRKGAWESRGDVSLSTSRGGPPAPGPG
jgi:dTMP kinase